MFSLPTFFLSIASDRRVRTWESVGKATRHEATFDMRPVAAGSYVVQAEAEGRVFTEDLRHGATEFFVPPLPRVKKNFYAN